MASRIVRESTRRREPERDAGGNIGFDQPSDDIDARPLGRQDQVNAGSPRHLRQARDRLLYLAPLDHHEVGQLVNDDDDVRQVQRQLGLTLFSFLAQPFHLAVELLNVAHTVFRQQLEALLHLARGVSSKHSTPFSYP